MRFEKDTGEERSDAFAVNARESEGALVFADADELVSLYPGMVHQRSLNDGSDESDVTSSLGDIWYPLFYIVLGLLVLETVLAYFFGRARRRVE